MRKLYAAGIVGMVIFVITVLSLRYSEAAMNPAPPFCAHQGYNVTERENGTQYCDFGDGNKCEIWQFFDGECGNEYRKDFPCVKEDQFVFSFEKCCDGLEPYLKCGMVGQTKCRQIPNIFQKFWEILLCLFGL
jgi:hypothetical protein